MVRIPYFIQLTNEVIEKMFRATVKEKMFDPNVPSLAVIDRNTPAYFLLSCWYSQNGKGLQRISSTV